MDNIKDLLNIIGTNIFAFLFLFLLTRVLGKKQLSQLTYFNYITGITIGSITANLVNVKNTAIYDNYISLIIWGLFTFILAFISLKSESIRKIFDGEPTIVIKKGKINRNALTKTRLNINDLLTMLRAKNIFSIKDVNYAIFETSGKISVLTKDSSTSNTKTIPTSIIRDGKIIDNNLKELNLTKQWLTKTLKKQNINTIDEILYAEIQDDNTLYIIKDK